MRIALVLMAGAVVLAGCTDRPSAAPPSEPHPPTAAQSPARANSALPASCPAQANELKRWMRDVAAEHVGTSFSARGSLVVVDEPRLDDTMDGPTLSLSGSQALFDGRPVADLSKPAGVAAELGSARAARIELWRQTHPGADAARTESEPLHVALAPRDAWSDVSVALEAARQVGYGQMTFTFELATKVAPPPETAASRAYETFASAGAPVDPSVRWMRDAENLPRPSTIAPRCPQIAESLQHLSERAMTPAEKYAECSARVPAAVEACGCDVDLDAIEAWWWNFNGRYGGIPTAWYTVAVAPRGEAGAVEIAAPASDTWASVSRTFVAAAKQGRPVRFVAR